VVITTTNASVLHELLGLDAIQIMGKPYDLEALVKAVQQAADDPDAAHDRTDPAQQSRDNRRHGDRRRGSARPEEGSLH
jgi:hypothetical protein